MNLSRFRSPLAALSLSLTALTLGLRAADQPAYMNPNLSIDARLDDLLPRLTLEEKVSLLHANSKFSAGGIPRLGIPALWTADGPQGVREEVGPDTWAPAGRTDDFATAMPVGMALASTWDESLAELYGHVLGEEARQRGKDILLAPALNIMRTPLCGRNYDYFGEDPWLAARMTVGYVRGLQAEQVAACIKHFVANNQEIERGSIDVQMDERTLREIYLPAFEAGVREADAWSIMGAYNRFRGEFCCHNDYLLNHILKGEWGFRGSVVSDWGGTHDSRQAALNGLDLEMGTRGDYADYHLAKPFLAGLRDGTYPESLLDDKARRNLRILFATGAIDGRRPGALNTPEHLAAARRIATEGMVLLKNDGGLLPLDPTRIRTLAVIGENAVRTFAAGGNSAGVKAFREITALQGIVARAGAEATITYAQGYAQPRRLRWGERDVAGVSTSELSAASPAEAASLRERALAAAQQADAVIFVGGLTHQSHADDEGTDRRDLFLPAGQDALIAAITAVNPRTVVVLISGSPVQMDPWLEHTPAVLQAWYGGSEAGNALTAVLFGDANPAGKLPCTFPRRLSDSPAHASGDARQYPGEAGAVHYDEGLLVGYRWYDTQGIVPLFPFGHGLSYTTFAYDHLTVTPGPDATATVALDVTNTGSRAGAEIVQLYVHERAATVQRPEKELKGSAKVLLAPGETQRVTLTLGQRAFAHYAPEQAGWVADAGIYDVLLAASAADVRLRGTIELAAASTTH